MSGSVREMELVSVTIVATDPEAEIVCGLLRTNGVDCPYRQTNVAVGAAEGLARGGPVEILVSPGDLDEARRLLAAEPSSET